MGFLATSQKREARTPSLDTYAISRHKNSRVPAKKKIQHICGRKFLTIYCLKCGHTQKILTGSRDRTCPACGKELYIRLYKRYNNVISGRSDLKLLTLTSKPVPKQSVEVVRKLGHDLVCLLHRRPYCKVWRGVLASFECKKTDYGWFYYHVHIILSGDYVSVYQISKDWREISGFPIVNIKRVWRTPKRVLNYVLKYVLKGFSFDNSKDRLDFKHTMKGVRYLRSYGDFYDSQYARGDHVYYPCPVCGAKKCWVVWEFVDTVELFEGVPYYRSDEYG